MNGADLRYLTGVASLVRLDIEAAALTLISDGTKLTALYVGNYSGGWRDIEQLAPVFTISLNAAKASQAAALFEGDEEITIKAIGLPYPDSIQLTGKSSRVSLQKWNEPNAIEDVGRRFGRDDIDAAVILSGESFLEEITIAAEFTAETTMRPIFNGIRLQNRSENTLVLTAYDGSGLLYQSEIEIGKITGQIDVVVADKDLLLGLKLVTEPGDLMLSVLKGGTALVIRNAANPISLFRCATLSGSWPNMSTLTDSPITGSRHSISSNGLKALANAGKFLDEIEISLEPVKNSSVFKIQSTSGSYLCSLKGRVAQKMIYNADLLAKLYKIADEVDLIVPAVPESPTFAEAGSRHCWIAAMYSARR